MDRVKGGYSSEAARRRFFRDYFDFHRWIRAALCAVCRKWGLPTGTIAQKADMATALIVEQWKKMTAAA